MSKEYPLYDKHADRWYRWDGNCKEFEPDNIFIHGKPEKKAQPQEEQRGFCPFRNHHIRCSWRCAMYDGKGCIIAAKSAKTDTKGKACPFSSFICGRSCAAYNSGCTLIEKGLKE